MDSLYKLVNIKTTFPLKTSAVYCTPFIGIIGTKRAHPVEEGKLCMYVYSIKEQYSLYYIVSFVV